MTTKKYDLENRLVEFASLAVRLTDTLNTSYAMDVLKKQLIRSAISTALNFGEVQGAESKKDFIHKNRLVLKELKECRVNLKLMNNIIQSLDEEILKLLDEVEQLIAIVYTIIKNSKQP